VGHRLKTTFAANLAPFAPDERHHAGYFIACGLERADVLVMSHTIDPAHAWILDCARGAATSLLDDIDENLFEPPRDAFVERQGGGGARRGDARASVVGSAVGHALQGGPSASRKVV